ncbi:MAG TPA: hypothetical protein PK995_02750 [Bacteroidia bacterium]|nr:hypothetical protein [Bacteroidia bacterium]
MKKVIAIVLSGTIIVACVAKKLAEPTEIDVEKGKTKFENLTLDELKEGKNLYTQHCNTCHKLFSPTSQTEEEWNKIIPIMVKKANKKAGQTIISPTDEEKIKKYLVVLSLKK